MKPLTVTIKAFPAKNGESLLISYGQERKKHFLIDCGYASTYSDYIKNDLIEISKNGECLERLIISHIDSDHIAGAIMLLSDLAESGILIKEVWHNSFRHLPDQLNTNQAEKQNQQTNLDKVIRRGSYNTVAGNGEQPISAFQGTTLGALILKNNLSWNSDFSNNAVSVATRLINIDDDSALYLLSPDHHKLLALNKVYRSELSRYGINYTEREQCYDDAFEMLMSWEKSDRLKGEQPISLQKANIRSLLAKTPVEDTTSTNGSSIAFILEAGERKILLLSDAHPGLILESLLAYQPDGIILFDLIKVAHHGSFRNINLPLLDKVDAAKYLFCTNGDRHGHPDRETVAHIVGRKTKFTRHLYFNYRTIQSKYFDREDWMNEFNYTVNYIDTEPYMISL